MLYYLYNHFYYFDLLIVFIIIVAYLLFNITYWVVILFTLVNYLLLIINRCYWKPIDRDCHSFQKTGKYLWFWYPGTIQIYLWVFYNKPWFYGWSAPSAPILSKIQTPTDIAWNRVLIAYRTVLCSCSKFLCLLWRQHRCLPKAQARRSLLALKIHLKLVSEYSPTTGWSFWFWLCWPSNCTWHITTNYTSTHPTSCCIPYRRVCSSKLVEPVSGRGLWHDVWRSNPKCCGSYASPHSCLSNTCL